MAGANKYQVCWDGGATCQEVSAPTITYTLLAGHDGKTLYVQSSADNGTNWSVPSATVTYTLDTTPPTTSAHSVSNIVDTTADFNATINENGTGYYIVQATATAAPSVAQIMAGQDGLGNAATASGSSAMTASTQKTFNITGLMTGTSYKVYFVAKDSASTPNVQVAAISVTVSTV